MNQQQSLFEGAGDGMLMKAEFSECRTWRYSLTRKWSNDDRCTFICLNPSTADEVKNDPTVTRCINFAKTWGYGEFVMLNLFAFRATDPGDMKAAEDPVGPDNDQWILNECFMSTLVVAGWGVHGSHLYRDQQVQSLLKKHGVQLYCLGQTQAGHPKHPLYLKKDLKPYPLV